MGAEKALDQRFPSTGDAGADLIVDWGECRIAVQCKRSGKPVGNRAVQEAASAMTMHNASVGIVVTDIGFTKPALQAAYAHGVYAILHEEIPNFLDKKERKESGMYGLNE